MRTRLSMNSCASACEGSGRHDFDRVGELRDRGVEHGEDGQARLPAGTDEKLYDACAGQRRAAAVTGFDLSVGMLKRLQGAADSVNQDGAEQPL